MTIEKHRKEADVFADLARLCTSPGYVHSIAYFCYRDNTIRYNPSKLKPTDLGHQFEWSSLTRKEISALIGLMVTKPIDLDLPIPAVMQEYIDQTERLLLEIHHVIAEPLFSNIRELIQIDPSDVDFIGGPAIREPVFYGGESAHGFQYRAFAEKKYANDNLWLQDNKGFSIEDACKTVTLIHKLQDKKTHRVLRDARLKDIDAFTILPAFIVRRTEVTKAGNIPEPVVTAVLKAFSLTSLPANGKFESFGDFNEVNAYPLIPIGEGEYFLLSPYTLDEALYDTPFFWMNKDKEYASELEKHRGDATEIIAADCLTRVFGSQRVFHNVELRTRKRKIGEIDVLAVFADRAIVVQAKAKRLRINARQGNDLALKHDFEAAIQKAVNQGVECAKAILTGKCVLYDENNNVIRMANRPIEIYLLSVVLDHYPALSYQARHFLTFDAVPSIRPPFVMDVFFLDVMTEMLSSPLYLLSYLDRRASYQDRVMAMQELTILSYHLTNNLWFGEDDGMYHLGDDIGADIDAAMMVRREGIPGDRNPKGLLTMHRGTAVGRLLHEIEKEEHPSTVNLAIFLLELNENSITQLNKGIALVSARAREDGQLHDISIGASTGGGITVHCSELPKLIALKALDRHCRVRKYSQKSDRWFGLCLDPFTRSIRFGIELQYGWVANDDMEESVATLEENLKRRGKTATETGHNKKVGRNEPCPCGSGRKYKHCCLNR